MIGISNAENASLISTLDSPGTQMGFANPHEDSMSLTSSNLAIPCSNSYILVHSRGQLKNSVPC